jgi:hypothetical protein
MKFNTYICAIFLSVVLLAGCEELTQDAYEEFFVIESYAIADRPLPDITIKRTVEATEFYDDEALRVNDASVQLLLLDGAGNIISQYNYDLSGTDGIYSAENQEELVQAGGTYQFLAEIPGANEPIRATTIVPDTFEIISDIPDQLIYQGEDQLEITITNTTPEFRQNVFVFSTIAQDPTEENLTPFYKATFEDDDDVELNDFIINSSGLINEGSFDINPDNTITLRFPWLGVAFYGENMVVIDSVDENLFDLVRSQEVQLGGSTLSPGEIPNVLYNTEGAIGIFGSMATDTVRTRFVRGF